MNLPNKKYKIIYADPSWKYDREQKHPNSKDACNKYETMNLKDMFELPIKDICEEDCVLCLWVTFPKLQEGLALMKLWGFEYTTNLFTWIKENKKSDSLFWGMGRYTRANSEICLLGTKKKKLNVLKHNIHSVIISKIREHSRKPDEVRKKIVELFGDLPRIELFARNKSKGWDVWGNEVESDITLNSLN